jgi:transcriptional regulator with XRE-family HTH domain
MALREKLSVREISRRTGLSRNTIAKYLSAGTIEPTFTAPERPSKLDPFADKLSGWLKTEAGRSRKQRRTLKQLHADLMALGFTGSYGRVAAFAREWRVEQQTAGRGMSGGIVMGPYTVDPAPEKLAVVIDDEGGEWNAAAVDMLHGEGDGLLHELRQAG